MVISIIHVAFDICESNIIINPRRMRRRVTVVAVCVCVCVCLSVTKLTATYLVCKSKVQDYKVLYGVPKAWFVWISPKTLCSPVLASFANSKLLDFSRVSDSMTLRINRKMCVACYNIRYSVCTSINPRRMRIRHDCKMNPGHLSPLATFQRSWNGSARGFFLTLRVCMLTGIVGIQN